MELKEKIGKIMELCYEVSTTTKVDAFYDYQAHVNMMGVRLYLSGWFNSDSLPDLFKKENTGLSFREWKEKATNLEIYDIHIKEEYVNLIDTLIDRLEQLLKEQGIC